MFFQNQFSLIFWEMELSNPTHKKILYFAKWNAPAASFRNLYISSKKNF